MVSLALLALASLQSATRPQTPDLTIQRWFSGEFEADGPEDAGKWRPDGKTLLCLKPEGGAADVDLVDAATGKVTVVIPADSLRDPTTRAQIRADECRLSDDGKHALIFANSVKVWRERTRGDYFVWDAERRTLRKVGGDAAPSSLMFAKLSPDGRQVGYVYRNDLYVEDAETGRTTRLTQDGSETLINGTSDWVYEEELDVRDGWRWSPDGKSVAFWQFDTSPEPIYTLIDDTDSLYPTLKRYPYPVAGQANATVRIGVVPAAGGPTVWMKDIATSESGYIVRMGWADNADQLIVQHLNRLQNENRYEVADARTGAVRTVYSDSDAAYIDILDTGDQDVRWVDGGRAFLVLSDHDGWRHVYAVPRDGGSPRLLTPGAFDVDAVSGYDSAHALLYFTASPEDASQRYLYSAHVSGEPSPHRLTPVADSGTNEYDVSPTGALAVHTLSRATVAPSYDLVRLPDHASVRGLGNNAGAKARFQSLHLGPLKFLKLDAADGQKMDACMIFPPGFDPHRRYPVLFFVYGEPASATVEDQWSAFSMFDWIISERGYIVVRVDNRGTPTLQGRAWRKAQFHKIGVTSTDDLAAAAEQVGRLAYVDPARMAIWGWSGGGSTTLNMMFRHPELYRLGMAVAPVPDTHLYDTIYQERYMGRPQENESEYIEGSPITFAGRLKGALLIVHGSGDDNVHFAGTEKLVNALVANNKPFQLMVYPNRTHSLEEGAGTQRHLYEMLLRFLTTNMPAK